MKIPAQRPGGQAGISYIEVLIATLLILITLLPMLDAMRGATVSATAHEDSAIRHAHLQAKMEAVLAEPFAFLATAAANAAGGGSSYDKPSAYSDKDGTDDRRIVYLSHYDGDNADADNNPFTGVEQDLLWVRTEIEGSQFAVESLVFR